MLRCEEFISPLSNLINNHERHRKTCGSSTQGLSGHAWFPNTVCFLLSSLGHLLSHLRIRPLPSLGVIWPFFGRGGSNLSFILWDSAYHLLLGCSLCGPILERCLALDSHPDYLWTQILATCLCFWWLPVLNILFFQTLSASKEGFSFVQDLCVNNFLPKLWTFPTTFIFYVLFCSLDFFQLL